MIAIVISVCLLSDPTVCRDEIIPLSSDMTPTRCVMAAPPHVARWSEEHPAWRVVRWRCGPAGRRDI